MRYELMPKLSDEARRYMRAANGGDDPSTAGNSAKTDHRYALWNVPSYFIPREVSREEKEEAWKIIREESYNVALLFALVNKKFGAPIAMQVEIDGEEIINTYPHDYPGFED